MPPILATNTPNNRANVSRTSYDGIHRSYLGITSRFPVTLGGGGCGSPSYMPGGSSPLEMRVISAKKQAPHALSISKNVTRDALTLRALRRKSSKAQDE